MFDLGLELFFVASNLVLLETHHHEWLEFLLFFVGRSSSGFFLGLVFELIFIFLDSLLVCFQLGFGVLVVCDLIGLDETMWVVFLF